MKIRRTGRCYFCGKQTVSTEHAPPQLLFKGFPKCDSITVPSCDAHNSEKADQAILYALLITLDNWLQSGRKVTPDVQRALDVARPSFPQVKRKAFSAPLFADPPQHLTDIPNVAYIIPDAKLSVWMKQLTAAMVFDAVRSYDSEIDWHQATVWSPDHFSTATPTPFTFEDARAIAMQKAEVSAKLTSLYWYTGWSSHPRPYPRSLYFFEVSFLAESDNVMFRHQFYGQFNCYVEFVASKPTRRRLEVKLQAVAALKR